MIDFASIIGTINTYVWYVAFVFLVGLGIYFMITLIAVAIAALAGTAAGFILSALSPMLLSAVSSSGSSLLDYYVTSFTLRIPFGAIALMILMMLSVSSLSILITLRRIKGTLQ